MKYKIEWRPKAFRQLHKIKDIGQQKTILAAVGGLCDWPECHQVKALQGREGYRLRVGHWRVLFDAYDTIRIIEIQEVRRRDEHTY